MKVTCALILSLILAAEGYGQVTTQVCQGQICVTLPPIVPPPTVAAPSTPPPATLAPIPRPVPAIERSSHTKGIVITAAVSAIGTWALVKLFKRKGGK